MPKQVIHAGQTFHLIPMQEAEPTENDSSEKAYPDGRCGPECHGGHLVAGEARSYLWGRGFPTTGSKDDGVIVDEEPSVYLNWSKAHDEIGGEGLDQGYIHVEVEVTEAWLRRMVKGLDNYNSEVPKPKKFSIAAGPLSWRDSNVLAKTIRDARDGAFGRPE